MFRNNKIEAIPFKDFMSRPATQTLKKYPLSTNVYSFFPPITISSFVPISDPGFVLFSIGCGLIALIAVSETLFAHGGMTGVSSFISSAFKYIFPATAYGLIFWFLLQI